MKMRNTFRALLLAAGTTAAAIAQADVYVYDTTTFPPRVVDVIPSQGTGYAYAPGYYGRDSSRSIWMSDPLAAYGDDAYGRWSWVPDDFVNTPEMFLRPNGREMG